MACSTLCGAGLCHGLRLGSALVVMNLVLVLVMVMGLPLVVMIVMVLPMAVVMGVTVRLPIDVVHVGCQLAGVALSTTLIVLKFLVALYI